VTAFAAYRYDKGQLGCVGRGNLFAKEKQQ